MPVHNNYVGLFTPISTYIVQCGYQLSVQLLSKAPNRHEKTQKPIHLFTVSDKVQFQSDTLVSIADSDVVVLQFELLLGWVYEHQKACDPIVLVKKSDCSNVAPYNMEWCVWDIV